MNSFPIKFLGGAGAGGERGECREVGVEGGVVALLSSWLTSLRGKRFSAAVCCLVGSTTEMKWSS